MPILDDARARRDAAPPPRRIDYDRMSRVRPSQKAALTRAIKVCKAAVLEWNAIGAWPDDWARWQNALCDALPFRDYIDLRDL